MPDIRRLEPQLRTADLYLHIDPCYLDMEQCLATVEPEISGSADETEEEASWLGTIPRDDLLVDETLEWCRQTRVKTLAEELISPQAGAFFCGVVKVEGDETVYEGETVELALSLPFRPDLHLSIRFRTEHLDSDAGWVLLSRPSDIAVVGVIREVDAQRIVVEPLVMGSATFEHPRNEECDQVGLLSWYVLNLYQTLPEDIDEFARIGSVDQSQADPWQDALGNLDQDALREKFAAILAASDPHETGGSATDRLASGVLHVQGRAIKARFLFADAPSLDTLTAQQLGPQGQRLAEQDASLVVLVHRGPICESVREMVRAFLLAPHRPRRYCLIDGRTAFRLLTAYGAA